MDSDRTGWRAHDQGVAPYLRWGRRDRAGNWDRGSSGGLEASVVAVCRWVVAALAGVMDRIPHPPQIRAVEK